VSGSLEVLLGRARRRLGWMVGLRQAAWALLGAVLVGEAGLALVGLGLPSLGAGLIALAVCGLAMGLALGLRAGRPSARTAAQVLDARLDSGAALASAAEALEGEHGRFRGLLLAEASPHVELAEGRGLSELLPVRAPTGLLLGAAAAAFIPVLLPGGVGASAAAATTSGPPSLLAAELAAGGGGAETGEPGDVEAWAVVNAGPDADQTLDSAPDPFAAFSPEVADLLRERVAQLARDSSAASAPGDGAGSAAGPSPEASDPLRQALRRGDPEAAMAALDALAEAAARGDASARLELEELGGAAAGSGGGALSLGALPSEATVPSNVSTTADVAYPAQRRERLPWLLREASRRYFHGTSN
jgi:hypothetical protein